MIRAGDVAVVPTPDGPVVVDVAAYHAAVQAAREELAQARAEGEE